MKYKAVIFDLFGTLVDVFSREGYYSTLSEMVSILKAPKDEFFKLWAATGEKRGNGQFKTLEENLLYICIQLNIKPTPRELKLAVWVRLDYVSLVLAPHPGAIETIAKLKADGYKIGLISNCSTEPPVIWPRTPFAPYFDVTIFSCSVGMRKPDPRIYQMAAEGLSVKPEDCLYIGDGDSGELEGAESAGMHPVLIVNPDEIKEYTIHQKPLEKAWQGPSISSLRDVLKLL
ncbi:MAG TPA: HAD family hydrolase [Dehalococcoidales bacterium]|nr:HAD family hydrolase [Dehalococcoidales bacterium]